MANQKKQRQSYRPWGLWIAIGIIVIAIIFECNDKNASRYQRSQQSYTTPASSETSEPEVQISDDVPASSKTSKTSSPLHLTPSANKIQNDEEEYDDQYDNPDFDDLVPGDEFDEEFMGSEGDPEVYPKE